MMTIAKPGLKVKAGIKAGAFSGGNHSRPGLKVKAGIKAGAFSGGNHSRPGLRVKTGVNAGHAPLVANHNPTPLTVD
jgi:hypothetical protein